jgi:hypothetical protein
VQAEGAIGLRQGRGGKGAEQVGGIHGGLFGCLSRGRYGLFGSRVLVGFCFWVFLLLPDLLLGFKRPIYLVDAFVVRRSAWAAVDATAYVMCSHVPPLFSSLCFSRTPLIARFYKTFTRWRKLNY